MSESRSGETSQSRHAQSHQYAAQAEQFDGWLGQGATAQSIRPVPPVIFQPAERPKTRSRARRTVRKNTN